MDFFFFWCESYDDCLTNLTTVLKMNENSNLILELGEVPLYGQNKVCSWAIRFQGKV